MLIVDIRKPVDPARLSQALRKAQSSGPIYALTPLAAWLLEQEGLPFRTGGDLVDEAWFRREGLLNHERLEQAFDEAFGSGKEPWLGLCYEFRLLLDYALGEERRWQALERAAGGIISDVAWSTNSSLDPWDHIYNRASLYFRATPPERFAQLRPIRGASERLRAIIRRLKPSGLSNRLRSLKPAGRRPALVTQWAYDWSEYRSRLEPHFETVSPARLAREAAALGRGASVDRTQSAAILTAIRVRYAPLLERTLDPLMAILAARAEAYAELRARIAHGLPEAARRLRVRGALGTVCGTPEDYLTHHYLKASGYPTLFHQHGGYMSRAGFLRHAEVTPATHNFAYGLADAEFLRGFRLDQPVHAVGCPTLEFRQARPPQPGRFLYVLLPHTGNATNTEGPLSFPRTDMTEIFRRHRRIIELFARHPQAELYLREHPAQSHGVFLHEPLSEVIRACGARNVMLDTSTGPDMLSGYEGILLDYVSTTVLHVLAQGHRSICHVGPPLRIDPAGEALLRRACACADNDDSFVEILDRWLRDGPPSSDETARRRYLELFGGATDSEAPRAWPYLERLLEPHHPGAV